MSASKVAKSFEVAPVGTGDASTGGSDILSPARLRAWAKRRTASASSRVGTSTSTRIRPAVARCRLTRPVVALLFPETPIETIMFPETTVGNVLGNASVDGQGTDPAAAKVVEWALARITTCSTR